MPTITPNLWFDTEALEADEYWAKLGEGGEFGPCGWLKDRYGLSWQIVPVGMEALRTDADPDWPGVPPMFSFRDGDRNTLYVVEAAS